MLISTDGNRETATILECVSASRAVIHPLVIYKGKWHQYSLSESIKDGEVLFAVSENGWTNSKIVLQWLCQNFEPQTKS